MPEPNTVNVALIVPNTGDLPGAWGTSAMNPNFVAIDGMLGGIATIALSSATTIALTLPSGSITPGAGPVQSQNALIKFTGTLTGNAVIQLGMPGRYVFHNQCTVGAFYVQVTSSGAGNACGLPPGQKVTIFHDGTNIDFVDTLPPGAAFDLHGSYSALPAWMTACTVSPYLIKDGTVYNISTYPALGAILGSTYGGNGSSTFGVPDERARVRVGFDPANLGRVSPVSYNTSGGEQNHTLSTGEMPSHTHTDGGHVHGPGTGSHFVTDQASNAYNTSGASAGGLSSSTASGTANLQNTGGGGAHNNMQPYIISHLPLIKT